MKEISGLYSARPGASLHAINGYPLKVFLDCRASNVQGFCVIPRFDWWWSFIFRCDGSWFPRMFWEGVLLVTRGGSNYGINIMPPWLMPIIKWSAINQLSYLWRKTIGPTGRLWSDRTSSPTGRLMFDRTSSLTGHTLIFMPPLFLISNYLPHLLSLLYPFIFLFAIYTVGITKRKIVSIGLLKKLLGVNDIDNDNYCGLTCGEMVLF